MRIQQEDAICEPGSEASLETDSVSTLILGFLTSLWETNFSYLLSHSAYGIYFQSQNELRHQFYLCSKIFALKILICFQYGRQSLYKTIRPCVIPVSKFINFPPKSFSLPLYMLFFMEEPGSHPWKFISLNSQYPFIHQILSLWLSDTPKVLLFLSVCCCPWLQALLFLAVMTR